MMRRLTLVLLAAAVPALPGCRKSPADAEAEWAQSLRSTLPAGWKVVALTGDPDKNRFMCWFEAPAADGRTCRVEVHVRPHPENPEAREWSVGVHQPNPRARHASVSFAAPDDGAGPLEVTREPVDPDVLGAARPLAEEAVRQVRGLGLF